MRSVKIQLRALLPLIALGLNQCTWKPLEQVQNPLEGFDPRAPSSMTCLPPSMKAYMRSQVSQLDPANIGIHMENMLAMIAFGQLAVMDEYENVRPFLASRWTISADGLKYTFTLDRRFRFSNGDPITSEDVIATFERLFSKEMNSQAAGFVFGDTIVGSSEYRAGKARHLRGIQALDLFTVEFTLRKPNSGFLTGIAEGSSSILPKNTPRRRIEPTALISAGPHIIESFSTHRVTLKRNPFYPKELFVPEAVFEYREGDPCDLLKTREFDVIDAGPVDTELCEDSDYDRSRYPGGNVWFVVFGKETEPEFRRQVIACANTAPYLDALQRKNTTARPLNGIFPDRGGLIGGSSFSRQIRSSPAAQTCLMDPPRQVELLISQRHHHKEELLSLFKPIKGLTVIPKVIDDLKYIEARRTGEYPMMLIEFSGIYSDLSYYAFLFHSKSGVIRSSYQNSDFDYWTSQLRSAVSKEDRERAVLKLNDTVRTDPPALSFRLLPQKSIFLKDKQRPAELPRE